MTLDELQVSVSEAYMILQEAAEGYEVDTSPRLSIRVSEQGWPSNIGEDKEETLLAAGWSFDPDKDKWILKY